MDDPLPHPASSIAARRILVIAPHPDDESLGCGGVLASLAALGARVHIVFVTDGGASHPGSATWPRERLSAQREVEAAKALAILGLGEAPRTFLRLPDAAMPALSHEAGRAALETLSSIVRAFEPDLVLLPWRRDPHCDHRDAWSLSHAALSEAERRPQTLEYAVWLDEIGAPGDHPTAGEAERVAFDISGAVAIKRAAVAAHVSQTTRLIADDPEAFLLTAATIDRLCGPVEAYWHPIA